VAAPAATNPVDAVGTMSGSPARVPLEVLRVTRTTEFAVILVFATVAAPLDSVNVPALEFVPLLILRVLPTVSVVRSAENVLAPVTARVLPKLTAPAFPNPPAFTNDPVPAAVLAVVPAITNRVDVLRLLKTPEELICHLFESDIENDIVDVELSAVSPLLAINA